jgi:hypothetical protein
MICVKTLEPKISSLGPFKLHERMLLVLCSAHAPRPAGPLEEILLELPVQDDDVALLQPVRRLPVREEGLGEAKRGHAQTPAQHEHVVVPTLGQGARTPVQ